MPEVGDSALALLQTTRPSLDSVLATLINELSAAPTELDLVLDDYHLIDSPDLQPGVAYLLEHLPPQVHLVISTRVDPALPLARLRARGELVEIRAADLRFTLTEVAAYLNDVAALELTPGDIASAGDAHRGLDRSPAAGGAVTAGACRRRQRSSLPSPATTATSWTTWPRRCSAANRRRSATSCSRPPSSTG